MDNGRDRRNKVALSERTLYGVLLLCVHVTRRKSFGERQTIEFERRRKGDVCSHRCIQGAAAERSPEEEFRRRRRNKTVTRIKIVLVTESTRNKVSFFVGFWK